MTRRRVLDLDYDVEPLPPAFFDELCPVWSRDLDYTERSQIRFFEAVFAWIAIAWGHTALMLGAGVG